MSCKAARNHAHVSTLLHCSCHVGQSKNKAGAQRQQHWVAANPNRWHVLYLMKQQSSNRRVKGHILVTLPRAVAVSGLRELMSASAQHAGHDSEQYTQSLIVIGPNEACCSDQALCHHISRVAITHSWGRRPNQGQALP